LIDEVELESFLKEASEAIDDADKLAEFIREKAAIAVERFVVSGTVHPDYACQNGQVVVLFDCLSTQLVTGLLA
jgi:hypothetical protein